MRSRKLTVLFHEFQQIYIFAYYIEVIQFSSAYLAIPDSSDPAQKQESPWDLFSKLHEFLLKEKRFEELIQVHVILRCFKAGVGVAKSTYLQELQVAIASPVQAAQPVHEEVVAHCNLLFCEEQIKRGSKKEAAATLQGVLERLEDTDTTLKTWISFYRTFCLEIPASAAITKYLSLYQSFGQRDDYYGQHLTVMEILRILYQEGDYRVYEAVLSSLVGIR